MEASKVITYSLLAQIRNSGNFVNSSVEIFVPIVKYALYKFNSSLNFPGPKRPWQ